VDCGAGGGVFWEGESDMKPKIVIVVEGGVIQGVLADCEVEYVVIDYDADCDLADIKYIPQDSGDDAAACAYSGDAETDPGRVRELFEAANTPAKETA